MSMRFDSTKMRELILYVARKTGGVGRVKMAKLLYYSDNEAYRQLGGSITWADYQKLPHGPAARQYKPTFAAMVGDGLVHEEPAFMGYTIVADVDPDPTILSDGEVAIIDDVIDRYSWMNAQKISEVSHQEIGWRVAEPYSTIPYTAFLLASSVPDNAMKRAAEVVAEKGWAVEPV